MLGHMLIGHNSGDEASLNLCPWGPFRLSIEIPYPPVLFASERLFKPRCAPVAAKGYFYVQLQNVPARSEDLE